MPVWGILQRIPQESEIDRYGGLAQAASELGCDKGRISTGREKAGTGVREEPHLEPWQIAKGWAILI